MPAQTPPHVELEVLRLNRTRRYAPSQIATETGVSKNTVHRILHRNGVKAFRVRPPVYTEEEEAEVIRRYVFEGEACEKIAPDMHMHHMTVIAIVRQHGYTVRPRGGARKGLSAEDCEPVRVMHEQGLLVAEIGERTGLTRTAISRRLKRAGVPARTRREAQIISREKGRRRR